MSRFTTLVLRDVAVLAWPVIVFLSVPNKIGIGMAMILVVASRQLEARARQMETQLTNKQKRVRAIIAAAAFMIWIVGALIGAVRLNDRGVWAVCILVLPVLVVFGYVSVIGKIRRDPYFDASGGG